MGAKLLSQTIPVSPINPLLSLYMYGTYTHTCMLMYMYMYTVSQKNVHPQLLFLFVNCT